MEGKNIRRSEIAEAARTANINYNTMYRRIKRGMTVEQAIALPVKDPKDSVRAKTQAAGVNYGTIMRRMHKNGMTLEEAIAKPVRTKDTSIVGRCRAAGVNVATIYGRIYRMKMTLDEALAKPVIAKPRKTEKPAG